MLSSKDIVPIAIFIVVVYLINKFIISTKESPQSVESGGGLVALTPTSKLLVTDDTGNLSTYTPATEGFTTNPLNVTGTSSLSSITAGAISGTSATFSGAVNLDGGVTCKSTSMINANGGITGTTATFSGEIKANNGITAATGKQICIGSTCLTEQDFKNVVNNLNAGGEEFNTYTPAQWYALFPNGGRKYHTIGYAALGITGFDAGSYGECETLVPRGDPNETPTTTVRILQTIRHSSYRSGTGLVMRTSENSTTWSPWEYKFYRDNRLSLGSTIVNEAELKTITSTDGTFIRHGNQYDIRTYSNATDNYLYKSGTGAYFGPFGSSIGIQIVRR